MNSKTRAAARRWLSASAAALALAAIAAPPGARVHAAETQSAAPMAIFNGIWSKQTPGLRYASAPPYRPEAKARFEAERPQDDPGARCTESGTARIMISPYPLQIIAQPDHLLVISEFNHVVRRIWNNKEFPPADEMEPLWYGNPKVRWEGQTMVVETTGYKAENYLDPAGDLMSDAMRITERWRLLDPDTMEIQFTFDDPKIYTQPWSSTQTFKRRSDWTGEFSCTENNRNNPDDVNNDKAFTSTSAPAAYNTTGPEGAARPGR